jgi:hypothetical protein
MSNLLSHQLNKSIDNMITGLKYKFMFRAVNSVGESIDSDIVEYSLVDIPDHPS